MKKILSLLLATLLLASLSMAQDAEYNLIRHSYKGNSDGSIDYTCRKELKLLRNRAFSAYGETFIQYNPAFETLKINEAYTLRPDGVRVNVPENAFVDQLPHSCASCQRFNGLREMAVVHTALEYEAIIVIDYTIHRNSPVLESSIQIQQSCPVKQFDIIVDLPATQSLETAFSTPIDGLGHSYDIINDHTFHLRAQNVPQTLIDSYLPKAERLYNIITLSNGMKPQPTVEAAPIDEATKALDELNDEDAMRYAVAIRDYVADYIRANSISPSLLNYTLSSAREVWLSGCGTAEEKNILLLALLRQAGFDASVDKESLQNVLVKIDGMEYKFSATDKNAPKAIGVANDEVAIVNIQKELEWNADELADGYFRIAVPTEKDALNITASGLTSVRTAPIWVRQRNEQYQYTIELPKSHKLVGGTIKLSQKENGIGSVEITVKQSGRTLSFTRHLTIEKDLIMPADYQAFHSLMQAWSLYRELYVKRK